MNFINFEWFSSLLILKNEDFDFPKIMIFRRVGGAGAQPAGLRRHAGVGPSTLGSNFSQSLQSICDCCIWVREHTHMTTENTPPARIFNSTDNREHALSRAYGETGWCLIQYSIIENWYQPKRTTGFRDIFISAMKSNKYVWQNPQMRVSQNSP